MADLMFDLILIIFKKKRKILQAAFNRYRLLTFKKKRNTL